MTEPLHGYQVKILADSIARDTTRARRLTTFQVTFARYLLSELNTHRDLTRSSASSRAIPVAKRIAAVRAHPFFFPSFGKNARGMQSHEDLDDADQALARAAVDELLAASLKCAETLNALKVHKQIANRYLEPFAWHTAIISATEWGNFFGQRDHADADPGFQTLAAMMRASFEASEPEVLAYGQWHAPMLDTEELAELRFSERLLLNQYGVETMLPSQDDYQRRIDGPWIPSHPIPRHIAACRQSVLRLVQASAGRCARVSYLTHEGVRDVEADIALARDTLAPRGHYSPLEHPAMALRGEEDARSNYRGFLQYRKFFPYEHDFSAALAAKARNA